MLHQLVIGSITISITIAIIALFVAGAIRILKQFEHWLERPPYIAKILISLIGVTLWILSAISLSVWVWAATFLIIDAFKTLEPALYFAIVSFTTLGFGDVILPEPSRLLSGLCAANGLLVFGLCAAFLVEYFRQLLQAQHKHRSGRR